MAISIGTLSYAAAAAAFLFLFLLLVTSWRGRLQGMLLATASLCNAIWAGSEAYLAARPDTSLLPSDVLEVVRNAVWFAFLMVLLGYSRQKVEPLRRAAAALAAFCGVVLVVTLYSGAISGTRLVMFEMLSHLALAVIGMVLVEQLYRNVRPQQRWGIKFLCLGLGGMFACDFYLYSESLLFRHVNEDIWAARGVVNAIIVPLLAVATARNPKWSLDIFVSRRILFHSAAMLGAAVYLLGMAAAGYYVRYVGGTWGGVLQVTFLFGAVLLLLVMMFSGTLRARLKVFLSKNFFNYRYDYREEWLRFTRTLSEGEPGIQLRERSIQAIAELVDSPGGILWLSQDTGELEQVAHWNMPAEKWTEQLDSSLCQFLEKRQWVIHLDNYDLQPEFYEGLDLPEWLRAVPRAWLVVPLMLHERLLGFVVLAKSKSNIALDWEVNDLLKTAGMQAASYLAQLEAATALLVARQFESFNRMSAFVVHDLKNLIAQLSLLLSNAGKHRDNPEFQDDMVQTIANAVDKMTRLLSQLRGGYSLEPPAPVKVHDVVRQAVAARCGLKPAPRFESSAGSLSVIAHSARLERVIGHLIQNAVEATPSDGQVTVQLSRQSDLAVIEISDTGCGMSEQFMRSRLYKPFESTKLTGMGIGTYETQQYVRELGGRIDVQTRESQGTTFRVMLPLELPDCTNAPGYTMEGHV